MVSWIKKLFGKEAEKMKAPVLPWVKEFEFVLGWHEVRDKARLSKWLKSDGATLGDPTQLPWCGDAMDTALELALPKEPRPGRLGENPYWAKNWVLLGVSTLPCYGAIAAFARPSGGHVGVLVGQTAKQYLVLGGNQGDSVSKVLIDKSRCIATRWPATFANPNYALPMVDPTGKPVSENEA